MLCCAVLCCAVLCCAVLCYAVLCYTTVACCFGMTSCACCFATEVCGWLALQTGLDKLHVPYSYGWSIILLTLLVKTALFPITRKQVSFRAESLMTGLLSNWSHTSHGCLDLLLSITSAAELPVVFLCSFCNTKSCMCHVSALCLRFSCACSLWIALRCPFDVS